MTIRWAPLGDSALTLVFADEIDPAVHSGILAVARDLTARPPRGVLEIVPAYTTIGVWFDPLERKAEDLAAELVARAGRPAARDTQAASKSWIIPVRYNGPDLDDVARALDMSPEEVVVRHTERTYRVYMLGFVPGWAFLGLLDPALELPRRSAPRPRVPAGSVAIAGRQTGVYPVETPGGWHLLGHTDFPLFDAAHAPPATLAVGDTVRFKAIA